MSAAIAIPAESPPALTPHARLERVEAVVNAQSGSVGPRAAERLEAILTRYGVKADIADAKGAEIPLAVTGAAERKPDLLIVLAGDGTAGLAARSCGPDGPLLMPLPGGTMNMLPHALYGKVGWEAALEKTLLTGVPRMLSGGEVDGRAFYVAAILGAPTLWARAREAVRMGDARRAWMRGLHALRHAFAGQLRFSLENEERRKTEALTLMCPLVSTAVDENTLALEAAVLNVAGAGEAFRLGMNMMMGDWRRDPSVEVTLCRSGRAWARGRLPAIIDGEPVRFSHDVDFRFVRRAVRVLVPAPEASPAQAAA